MTQVKLVLNPSRQADYEQCKLLYHRLHNLMLDLPKLPIDVKTGHPFLGSLVHATHAAYDTGHDYKKAVGRVVKDLHRSIHYNVKYAALVDQVTREALTLFEGGTVKDGRGTPTTWSSYPSWREQMFGADVPYAPHPDDQMPPPPVDVQVVDVEKRLWVDVGPVVLAPKLDAVICAQNVFGRDEETWWVEEHKVTGRDDSNWRWRWEMDGQTTCQIVAAEQHYDQEFEGVLVNQLLVTRRQQKDAPKSHPQPINKVIRYPARWVSKKPEVRAHYMAYLEDLARDFEARQNRGEWTATGMLNRHCDRCSHRSVCSGRQPTAALQPVPKDELQVEFERRHKKALPKEPDDVAERRLASLTRSAKRRNK